MLTQGKKKKSTHSHLLSLKTPERNMMFYKIERGKSKAQYRLVSFYSSIFSRNCNYVLGAYKQPTSTTINTDLLPTSCVKPTKFLSMIG